MNFVTDICRGFIELARCDDAIGKEINIGSGREISIGELARLIIGKINPHAKIISVDERKRPDKSEVERLLCDNTLINRLTGWVPQKTLEQGIEKTIEWFKNAVNVRGYKVNIYNV